MLFLSIMAIPTPNLCDSLSLCLYLISVPCLFCCHQQIVLFSTSVSETHSHFSAWKNWLDSLGFITVTASLPLPSFQCPPTPVLHVLGWQSISAPRDSAQKKLMKKEGFSCLLPYELNERFLLCLVLFFLIFS